MACRRQTVDAAFDASRRFFALAEHEKKRWHINGWPIKRGFDPMGWQSLDVGMPPDVKESFYTGNTSLGPNQWPDDARCRVFVPPARPTRRR